MHVTFVDSLLCIYVSTPYSYREHYTYCFLHSLFSFLFFFISQSIGVFKESICTAIQSRIFSTAVMASFFSLPIEIRFQIYRWLRSYKSPEIKRPSTHHLLINGYCSFGFQSRILETNRLVCSEAKEVFYGENCWTFFVSQRTRFNSVLFQIEPLILVLPFIRKAHIRFNMLEWLLFNSCGIPQSADGDAIKANVREICLVLLTATTLRTVKVIWEETSTTMGDFLPLMRMKYRDRVPSFIFKILKPLIDLPKTIELQKSNIMVAYSDGMKADEMELDFSECVDKVIARHRSKKAS